MLSYYNNPRPMVLPLDSNLNVKRTNIYLCYYPDEPQNSYKFCNMNEDKEYLQLEAEIFRVLKNIYDPEIPVSIYDLGLIYEVDVDEKQKVKIIMTLTAPNCPMADDLIKEVREKVEEIKGVKEVKLNLVFDPPWDKSMMSDQARLELGFM